MLEDNGFYAKVVLASVGPNGIPIYSVEARYPRFIHSELMTHRDRARNAASSRAIPWKRKGKDQLTTTEIYRLGGKIIGKGQFAEISLDPDEKYEYYVKNCMYTMIMTDPFIPISFGLEQQGMQSGNELTGAERNQAVGIWLEAHDFAVDQADRLANLGVHKSICNRLTEPFMWITTLFTATEWKNFFRLRCHPAAEKHFQKIAGMMREVISNCEPRVLASGSWHLPYVTTMIDKDAYINQHGMEYVKIHNALTDRTLKMKDSEYANLAHKSWTQYAVEYSKLISAGRSARLSYLTHDGVRDFSKDIELARTLIERTDDVIHASPLEHVNQASSRIDLRSGPMKGWFQFRKEFDNENVEG